MAHGLNLSRVEQTGATEAGGQNGAPRCTVETHANQPFSALLKSGTELEQNLSRLERSGADQLVAPVLQLGGYYIPPLTGGQLEHPDQLPRTGAEQDWQAAWSNPTAHYDGPAHDTNDLEALAAFWTEALTTVRASMRTRWPDYRGKVPAGLAAAIIDDIEAKGAACS